MEDYIYIVAAIAWFVYSAYKGSQKRANKKKKSIAQASANELEIPQTERPSMIEELLLETSKQQSKQQEKETVKPEYETIEADYANRLDRIPADYFDKNREEGISVFEYDKNVDISIDDEIQNTDFDLRKAIIFKTILERPYGGGY